MKKYNSFLGAFFSGDNGQSGYNAAYGKSALAKLYTSQDPAEQQAAAEGLARVDPETAGKWQQEQAAIRQEGLKRKATMIASAPEAYRPQLYSAVLPEIRKDWADAPEMYTPELDSMVQAWAQSVGGAGGQPELPADIRTNQWYLDQLGYKKGSEQEQAFLKMRAGQMPKAVPYNFKYDDYGNAYIEDKNKGTLSQAGTGGTVQDAGDPMQPYLDRIATVQKAMKDANVPVEQINAWSENAFADAQKSVASNGVTVAAPTPQAKIDVKPEGQMTDYQAEMLALAKQKEAQAAADRKAKVDLANQKKGDAEQKRNEAVIMSVDDTLNTIDRLEKSPGYAELGTAFGDVKLKTPLIRSDVKDANATLKTLAGQIALSTMANLKTLSASGATGFGALTAPELSLLQNSIATLQQEDVSNSQIVESIRVIKEKMAKIKQSAVGATSAPQGGGQAPVQVRNTDDYNRLPAGTQYIDPTGKQRVKK